MSGTSANASSTMIPSPDINVFDTSKAQAGNFFQGDFQSDVITRDPLVSGFAFIKWLKVPQWVTTVYTGFTDLTEKNLRNFGGIQDLDIQGIQIMEGFTQSENTFAGSIQRFQGFTMSHREYSGSPIRNAYAHWVTGIRDPATGIARYPKDFGGEYSAVNHTGELIYIMTRPDVDNTNAGGHVIEFACLFTMVMPTKVLLNHLNFQAGTNDAAPELEQSFFGVPHISAAVDNIAIQQLQVLYPFVSMGQFAPTYSGAGLAPASTSGSGAP